MHSHSYQRLSAIRYIYVCIWCVCVCVCIYAGSAVCSFVCATKQTTSKPKTANTCIGFRKSNNMQNSKCIFLPFRVHKTIITTPPRTRLIFTHVLANVQNQAKTMAHLCALHQYKTLHVQYEYHVRHEKGFRLLRCIFMPNRWFVPWNRETNQYSGSSRLFYWFTMLVELKLKFKFHSDAIQ